MSFVPDPSPAATADADPARRRVLGAGAVLAAAVLPGCALLPGGDGDADIGFESVPASTADRHAVPEGYVAAPLARWGDAVGIAASMPAWRADAGNSAAEQALQVGQRIAGLQYLPLDGSRHGLLVLVHDTVDDGALHAGGAQPWTAGKTRKAQAAVGLSVVEVALRDTGWQLLQPAAAARRITAATPLVLGGPAAGHALLKTAADPGGRLALGLLGAGAVASTPWGSCLVGERDWAGLFATADQPTRHERRYGLGPVAGGRWPDHDERFDAVRHPNEANRCGWVLEFDPRDPARPAVKRTALGRGAWSAVAAAVTADRRAVVYLADGGHFEALARFVSRETVGDGHAGLDSGLLDEGTLQLARFDADGSGRWLALAHGVGPLTRANGLADAGELLVKLRHASQLVGATPMDRVTGLAVDAAGWVHAARAANPLRGTAGRPAADAANPRQRGIGGRLLRWRETELHDRFEWALGRPGDDASGAEPVSAAAGDVSAAPASLARDPGGRLWIGTAAAQAGPQRGQAGRGDGGQLLACRPDGGDLRRFLTAPFDADITGCCFTPDGRTAFVAVDHPGVPAGQRSDPLAPQRRSGWPDFSPIGRPRSAVLAVRRTDGGMVGR